MIKIYLSTLLKCAKCNKILQNQQSNMNPSKTPPKCRKLSVVRTSLGVFWSFLKFSRLLSLFSGCFGHFLGFWIFWIFSVHFSHFGNSKGSFQRFLLYLSVFDIFGILTVKIKFFFDRKKTLEITRMDIILPKSPKHPQNQKMSKKIPSKPLN